MTTRAVDGGAAGGNEKLERTGVLRTWVVVTGANPEYRAEPLNPEIERLQPTWHPSEIFMESDPMVANVISGTPRIAAHEDEPFRFR